MKCLTRKVVTWWCCCFQIFVTKLAKSYCVFNFFSLVGPTTPYGDFVSSLGWWMFLELFVVYCCLSYPVVVGFVLWCWNVYFLPFCSLFFIRRSLYCCFMFVSAIFFDSIGRSILHYHVVCMEWVTSLDGPVVYWFLDISNLAEFSYIV